MNRTCDCQAIKVETPHGLLMCEHCDVGKCNAGCLKCRQYRDNVARRIIRDNSR